MVACSRASRPCSTWFKGCACASMIHHYITRYVMTRNHKVVVRLVVVIHVCISRMMFVLWKTSHNETKKRGGQGKRGHSNRYTINEEGSTPWFHNNLVYKVLKNANMMKSSHKKHEIKGKGNVITEFMKQKNYGTEQRRENTTCLWWSIVKRKELKERFFFISFAHFFFFKV